MRKALLYLMFSATFYVAQAQSLYNVNTTLSIGTNTVLFVADSIINDGIIINNGDIQVGGIWQNNTTYMPGIGQLTLTSNLPQVINHNNQSFTRLTISGGGEKIFGADITIENELVMNNGILKSNGNAKIIITENASVIGGSETSFIEGPLYQQGLGDKFYPIGINNVYLPVELLSIQGNNPTLGVLLNTPNTNMQVEGSLIAVTNQQYWQLDVLAGDFDNALVKLPLNDEVFLDDIAQSVVVQGNSLANAFSSIGGINHTGDVFSGTVTSQQLLTDTFFTIGAERAELTSDVNVYNAISPNADGINDFLKIENIALYPNNVITIYTRWGDKVFEQTGYNNVEHVFEGKSNIGKKRQLLDGTYYYVLEKGDGSKNVSGFIVLRN